MQINEWVPEDLLTPIFEQLRTSGTCMRAVSSATRLTERSRLSCIGPGIRESWSTLMPTTGSRDPTRYFSVHCGGGSRILNDIYQIFDPVQTFLQTPELLQ